MKKLFIVSDVHSFYDELMQALTDSGFDLNDDDHIFVSCGDLLDRGQKSLECLQFVNSIPNDRKILIKGNHEQLMLDIISRGYFLSHDYHNGSDQTVQQVTGISTDSISSQQAAILEFSLNKDWKKYINFCRDYYEDDKNIFVHGWIPCYYSGYQHNPYDFKFDLNWRDGNWKEAAWFNGMNLWRWGIVVPDKTIYCGHWHSAFGHRFIHESTDDEPWELEEAFSILEKEEFNKRMYECTKPFVDSGIIALDACTVCSQRVNCITVEVDAIQL